MARIELTTSNGSVLRLDDTGDGTAKVSILDKRGHFRGIAKLDDEATVTLAMFLNGIVSQ